MSRSFGWGTAGDFELHAAVGEVDCFGCYGGASGGGNGAESGCGGESFGAAIG
jgi:hypothetical protein